MEHTHAQPSRSDRASTLEDSPDSSSPTQNSPSEMPKDPDNDDLSEPLENRQSKIANGKRPYVKTPARLAAARANLEKARAAPKEKVYRPTGKRLTANRANLAKAQAAREKQLEGVVERLDIAFPPLGEAISEEAVEPEFMCPCGSGKTFLQCCKGRKSRTGIAELNFPRDPPSDLPFDFAQGRRAESRGEDDEADRPQVPRIVFRFGTPKWVEEGVDREAADYGALEKAGRALLRRQRALVREVRHEGRQVMHLLTQAAARTVAPTLRDLLALAGSLMAVFVNPRLAGRAQRLNRRVAKLLQAFVEKRYERAGVVVSVEAAFQRLMGKPEAGLPPRSRGQKRSRPTSARTTPTPQPSAAQPDRGPDLPKKREEFVNLVRRAFCAPQPEPEDEAVRHLIDDVAGCLWDCLRTLEAEVLSESERLNQLLDELGDTPPDENRNPIRERCWLIEAELKQTVGRAGTIIQRGAEVLPRRLGTLMMRRHGPGPEIERFCKASEEQRVRFARQSDH